MKVDPSKSLNQMYGQPDTAVSKDDYKLAIDYETSMASPLAHLGVDDLQLLLRQHGGWEFIIPYVLDRLEENFAARQHDGSFLDVLLHRPEDAYWAENPETQARAVKLLYDNEARIGARDLDIAIFFIERNGGDGSPKLSFWGESPNPN